MKLNEILKKLRSTKNLSQNDMAEILNVSLSSYQKYERDKNCITPSLDVLMRIADYYNVSLDYLLGREPLPNPLAGCEKDEAAVIEKYLSLPSETRKCALDVLRQLGETVQKLPQDNKK